MGNVAAARPVGEGLEMIRRGLGRQDDDVKLHGLVGAGQRDLPHFGAHVPAGGEGLLRSLADLRVGILPVGGGVTHHQTGPFRRCPGVFKVRVEHTGNTRKVARSPRQRSHRPAIVIGRPSARWM